MRDDRVLQLDPDRPAPDWAGPDGLSFPEQLVEELLEEFSSPGDVVLDPFVGYGTTMLVAERLGRRGVGVELLADRIAPLRDLVAAPEHLHVADARSLHLLGLGPIDLSISSPPYMPRRGHPENPLTGYATFDGDYELYLDELAGVYATVAELLRGDGPVLLNVATMRIDDDVTDLAADLAAALDGVLRVEERIEVRGAPPASWLVEDHVLVCRPR